MLKQNKKQKAQSTGKAVLVFGFVQSVLSGLFAFDTVLA